MAAPGLRIEGQTEPVEHSGPTRLDAACEVRGHIFVGHDELAAGWRTGDVGPSRLKRLGPSHSPRAPRVTGNTGPLHLNRVRPSCVSLHRNDLGDDAGDHTPVIFEGDGESETPEPDDLDIYAGMLDVLAVVPVHETKCASNARVDPHDGHRTRRRREQPSARDPGVQPGIENALRRCRDLPGRPDLDTSASPPSSPFLRLQGGSLRKFRR